MTEPLLCRTADGKIHWTTQSAGGGLIDSREYKTYCGQQVVSVIHEPIASYDWYHNLTDEEKQHVNYVDKKIMEDWDGELCQKCQNKRYEEERMAWGF
jgi:hypothetical protein